MKLLIVDHYFSQAYADALRSRFPDLDITHGRSFAEVADAHGRAEAVFALGHLFNDALVARMAALRWIQALTTGTDAIQALTTLPTGVAVTSARGIHAPQMSEMAFIHMLALAHQLPRMLRNQQQGRWERWPQSLLYRKRVLILGVGIIAEGLARRCKAFDMEVIGISGTPRQVAHFDRIAPRADLHAELGGADYVVSLVPAGPDTDGSIDASFFRAMRPSAFFVNMSRGSVVDEAALLHALRAGTIAGAGLDAFATEPLPAGHPFWREPRLLISPKHGGTTEIYVEQVMPILEHNVACYLDGRLDDMKNIVRRAGTPQAALSLETK